MSGLAAIWPFRPSRADRDADLLLSAVTQIARQPNFYGEGRVPDTLQGRLEMMTIHACLAFIRMQADAGAEPLAQLFADKLFRHYDAGLREDGVGDLSVSKRMKKLAQSFYGSLAAYSEALAAADQAALAAALGRNVFRDEAASFAPALAAYVAETARLQAPAPVSALFRLDGWAPAPN